ncbi:putative ABC transporter-associated repeat protein [Cryobacterium sp. MP_3.1]|uniref:choice-of-anchor M domain-containing protein n=1 Tax=Cryobacterium sp. MP_3.1 TaxID=3071711 RepID=UPI002E093811|nr:putative ABC transporter-associated repeat protein [Cryobacterium sp. MP_3.1]
MTHPRDRQPPLRPRGITLTFAAVAMLVAMTVPSAASAQGEDDPNLDQQLGALAIVHGDHVLDTGHIDLGPRFDDGEWRFLIHDDAAKADAEATSVWRYPAETVLHVLDTAELTVPDDPAYAFLGAEAGSTVWVVPQTQNTDVVWLGWNTQDPEVMDRIDRGITLTMTSVQGPGPLDVYLQSGSFGEPQVLFNSRLADPQPAWVDVNTHTHANWVFSEPGIYLVELQASADLIDGTHVEDTQRLRFAVGTETPTADALTATWTEPGTGEAAGSDPGTAATTSVGTTGEPLVPILIGAIAFVAAGLVSGVILVSVRGSKARRRALTARVKAETRSELAAEAGVGEPR